MLFYKKLIVFLPLLGSSVAGFFGRSLGSEGTAIMTTTCVSFFSILFLFLFIYIFLFQLRKKKASMSESYFFSFFVVFIACYLLFSVFSETQLVILHFCFILGLALSGLILSVSGGDEKSSETLKALLNFPNNTDDLQEVSSLEVRQARTVQDPGSQAHPNLGVQAPPPAPEPLPQQQQVPPQIAVILPPHQRWEELQDRLSIHHTVQALCGTPQEDFVETLRLQNEIEDNLFTTLNRAGVSAQCLLTNRHKIRAVVFYHLGDPATKAELKDDLFELRQNPAGSPPVKRVLKAHKDYLFDLDF